MTASNHPVTLDGRYFVAKGRLWRKSDPRLSEEERQDAVRDLMKARRAVKKASSAEDERAAREAVDAAKRRLGERGPVWWDDGAPDETHKAPWNSSYAEWWAAQEEVCEDDS
ncbi:hypothetical protein [Fulvimarina sp. MAC8]|uniref:hypothetical protein n=1 Tax=Fulvimarina sp. MAC8 TaxID=3162874 RepID=UPI0032EB4B8F